MDREAQQATVHGVAKSLDMTEQLSVYTHTHTHNVSAQLSSYT